MIMDLAIKVLMLVMEIVLVGLLMIRLTVDNRVIEIKAVNKGDMEGMMIAIIEGCS